MTINVTKYRLNPDRIFAGTRGSFGMEKLSFDFGDGWDFDTISVTFHPQRGKPIKVPILPGTEIDIPAEVMEHSGESRFVVSGRAVGEDGTIERQAITLEGYVDVAYTADEKGGNTRKVTPDMYDHLIDQASKIFDEAREDVERTAAEAAGFASGAEGFANSAEEDADSAEKSASAAKTAEQAASKSAGEAKTAADTATGAASNAAQSADDATSAASAAKASATTAENSRKSVEQIAEGIPKTVQNALQEAKDSGEFDGEDGITPHIGENENWYIGNKDTGVRAKGKSGVHVGSDTPPAGTRVWVNPDGERTKIPKVDDTLTKPGYAADAAKVGEKINQLSGEIAYITPQMFGAVGDGVADDTAAIQAAFDKGGYIYFPAGRYKTTDLLTVSKSCRIEMFKQYPNTYKAEYPLTPDDNWMGARIDTYSPNGGMIIGDAVEVDGLYIRAMEGFAGVILKFDNTVGKYTYPASARLKHIKLEIDSPNTIPVSMFDFTPDGSYHYILEDICLGRNGDAGYCEYGFRTLMSQTSRKWAYNVTIRNLCIDLHADYPLYIIGDDELGLTSWLFEMLTIQAYKYNRNEADSDKNVTNRPGHINLITLKNTYLATFVNSYLWDVTADNVIGDVINAENVRATTVIGCSEHFDAIESYLSDKMKAAENLNISNLEMSVKDNMDGTANTLVLFDGSNEKTVDIPKVQMSDDQIGNAVGTWMDANAEPKEVPGKNKFNYASEACILAQFRVASDGRLVFETTNDSPSINSWVSDYIEVRVGDIIRVTCNNVKRNPAYLGFYNAKKELIAIGSGYKYEDAQNGIRVTAEGTMLVRVQFNPSTYGNYEDRATANVCVTVNDPDVAYEDYYTELVGGIGSFMALQSPNGTKYTLTVSDDGVLSAVPAE